ncbi:MAG TPA: hypothetical protein VM243_03620 [Phycisphaerae bacterium]|nr:hypothetical protein [Phycisphaerae bacterium]
MSALRISLPGYLQLIDQGPAHYVAIRGRATLRGHLARPAPAITEALREKWRKDKERQRSAS